MKNDRNEKSTEFIFVNLNEFMSLWKKILFKADRYLFNKNISVHTMKDTRIRHRVTDSSLFDFIIYLEITKLLIQRIII